MRRAELSREKGDIGDSIDDPLGKDRRGYDRRIEPEVRKRVGDLGQHEQTEWKVEAVDVYRLRILLLQRVDLGGHLLQVEEDAVGMGEQYLSIWGDGELVMSPVEQRAAKFSLKLLEVLAQCRLRNEQLVGRFRMVRLSAIALNCSSW